MNIVGCRESCTWSALAASPDSILYALLQHTVCQGLKGEPAQDSKAQKRSITLIFLFAEYFDPTLLNPKSECLLGQAFLLTKESSYEVKERAKAQILDNIQP